MSSFLIHFLFYNNITPLAISSLGGKVSNIGVPNHGILRILARRSGRTQNGLVRKQPYLPRALPQQYGDHPQRTGRLQRYRAGHDQPPERRRLRCDPSELHASHRGFRQKRLRDVVPALFKAVLRVHLRQAPRLRQRHPRR